MKPANLRRTKELVERLRDAAEETLAYVERACRGKYARDLEFDLHSICKEASDLEQDLLEQIIKRTGKVYGRTP